MLIVKFVTERPELAHSRTAEDFQKFLGARPEMLGLVSRLYPNHTASFLTESLMNVYYKNPNASKFSKINSLMFEWEIDVEFIKRIQFAAVPTSLGAQDYSVKFKERYYEKNDTFRIEESRQSMIVMAEPIKQVDGTYEYICQLIDADYSSVLDTSFCQVGMNTLFMSNYQPEYHEEGLKQIMILIIV